MIKPYTELYKIDVTPYCDMREASDDKGRKIQVPYLRWGECMRLLHENGAEYVNFVTVPGSDGSSLIKSDLCFTDKNGNVNRCYEVCVDVTIDDKHYIGRYPVMNGANPVKDNSMSQQRLWNAATRAFVKTVAMATGLGFSLWTNDVPEDVDTTSSGEDLSIHSLPAIKERFQIEYTDVLKKHGMSPKEVADGLGMSVDEVKAIFAQFDTLMRFEQKLAGMR